jgi:hypothetical protein
VEGLFVIAKLRIERACVARTNSGRRMRHQRLPEIARSGTFFSTNVAGDANRGASWGSPIIFHVYAVSDFWPTPTEQCHDRQWRPGYQGRRTVDQRALQAPPPRRPRHSEANFSEPRFRPLFTAADIAACGRYPYIRFPCPFVSPLSVRASLRPPPAHPGVMVGFSSRSGMGSDFKSSRTTPASACIRRAAPTIRPGCQR